MCEFVLTLLSTVWCKQYCFLPSGYWIAHRAVKTIYDHEDGFVVSSHDQEKLKEKVFSFFNVSLDVLLSKFLFAGIIGHAYVMYNAAWKC